MLEPKVITCHGISLDLSLLEAKDGMLGLEFSNQSGYNQFVGKKMDVGGVVQAEVLIAGMWYDDESLITYLSTEDKKASIKAITVAYTGEPAIRNILGGDNGFTEDRMPNEVINLWWYFKTF